MQDAAHAFVYPLLAEIDQARKIPTPDEYGDIAQQLQVRIALHSYLSSSCKEVHADTLWHIHNL